MPDESDPLSETSPPTTASQHPRSPSPHSPTTMLPSAPGKRRTAAVTAATLRSDLESAMANHPSSKLAAFPSPHSSSAEVLSFPGLCDMRTARRKRLIVYSIAFATMLALSSVLDIRRAELKHRQPKVQLSLPSGSSIPSLADASDKADTERHAPRSPADGNAAADPNLSMRPFGQLSSGSESRQNPGGPNQPTKQGPPPAVKDDSSSPTLSSSGAGLKPPSSSDQDPPQKSDPNLSDQELKDDVDQLIAHVDEEASHDNSTVSGASSEAGDGPTDRTSERVAGGGDPKAALSGSSDSGVTSESSSGGAKDAGSVRSDVGAGASNGTVSGVESEVRLTSEEHFGNAQKRLQALLADESLKKFADENDLRILEALVLQATRGDCEQKSGSERGSLFKTDAEAASNVDIERTDPLWGAWCLFMGNYKTDAMRDYVTKQGVVEEKMVAAKAKAESNTTEVAAPFDPNAASLDDVMKTDQQSELRVKTDTLVAHLREYDVRYLAALSLQATFGDCGPYGKETLEQPKEGEETVELRKLKDPLLDQTVTRREGAQWGAWCVFQGSKRSSAAAELTRRVNLLVNQLSKTQRKSVVGGETRGEDGLSRNTVKEGDSDDEHS